MSEPTREELIVLFTKHAHIHFIISSCANCSRFEPEAEQCLLAMRRPPAKVIAVGCKEWTEDLPF